MKFFWKALGKEEYVKSGKPYYKDLPLFILSLILSIAILLRLFYFFIVMIDKYVPFGDYT